MDLVCTEEMKQLLTSPIIKETKPVTNGTTNQQAMDSESLPTEMSILALTPASTASSLLSTPSSKSHLQMLTGMTPPANSEPLDPTFLHVWPHPQRITQIKGTRFFPTSVLPVVLFRDLQSDHFQEICEIWNTVNESFEQVGYTLDLKVVGEGKTGVF
ncbi:uncharacterized protein LOC110044693 [Orbicella faveolata]|uniref:uncharacterized protein LOC110044693 n=1 Tax=Orbicella faveolata TaxID=48498 RepID=UPI0009E64E2F|nr:uncharacterized protein LOC110044693 [Orbicella faveolata]